MGLASKTSTLISLPAKNRNQFRAAAIRFACGLFLSAALSLSALATNGEFVPHDIGYPVAGYKPVDVNNEGIWELAIRTADTPNRYGVFSVHDDSWLEGPRELPGAPRLWDVGDWNGDNVLEYAYVIDSTIRLWDAALDADSVLRELTFRPIDMKVWGRSTSDRPTVALLKSFSYDTASSYDFGQEVWSESVDDFRWVVETLFEGESVAVIPGARAAPAFAFTLASGERCIALYESWRQINYFFGLGHSVSMRQGLSVFDQSWTLMTYESFPGYYVHCCEIPRAMWTLNALAAGTDGTSGMTVLAWENAMNGDGVAPALHFGGVPVSDSGQLNSWLVQYFQGYPPNPWRSPLHTSVAVFDFDKDGSLDLLMPFADSAGWEIRDAITGAYLSSDRFMPSVHLATAPLMASAVDDLFYIDGEQVYIWQPDVVTDVAEHSANPIPHTFQLVAYPNPSNSGVTLQWDGTSLAAQIKIYNVLGRAVRTILIPDAATAVEWNGRDDNGIAVSSGVYFARLVSASRHESIKLVLLK